MSFSYIIQEGLAGFNRAKLAAVGSVVTITIALLFFGIFYVISENTSRIIDQLRAKLEMEVFLKDMRDFQAMNAVYAERLSHAVKPARYTFEVAKLPMDARIEICCTAFVGG